MNEKNQYLKQNIHFGVITVMVESTPLKREEIRTNRAPKPRIPPHTTRNSGISKITPLSIMHRATPKPVSSPRLCCLHPCPFTQTRSRLRSYIRGPSPALPLPPFRHARLSFVCLKAKSILTVYQACGGLVLRGVLTSEAASPVWDECHCCIGMSLGACHR